MASVVERYVWMSFKPGAFRVPRRYRQEVVHCVMLGLEALRQYLDGGLRHGDEVLGNVVPGDAVLGNEDSEEVANDLLNGEVLHPVQPGRNALQRILVPEVLHIILGFLHPPKSDDAQYHDGAKRDLRSCSLVCRSWNLLVRGLLFRDFAFAFVAEVPPSSTGSTSSVGRPSSQTLPLLLQFLSDNRIIARCIRRLRLDCWSRDDSLRRLDSLGHSDDAFCRIPRGLIVDILRAIPRLEDVFLYNLYLEPPLLTDQSVSAIRRLRICFYDHTSGMDSPVTDVEMSTVLGCFSTVKELEIINTTYFEPDHGVPEEVYEGPQPLCVESLVLQRDGGGWELYRQLSNLPLQAQSLRRVVLRQMKYFEDDEQRYTTEFLRIVSPQLEELRLYLHHDHESSMFSFCFTSSHLLRHTVAGARSQTVELPSCDQLRELTIGFTLPVFVATKCHGVLDDLVHLLHANHLSRSRQSVLQEIILEITFDVEENSEEVDHWLAQCGQLGTIDEALVASAEQCGLEGIIFECRALGEIDTRATVVQMFPQLSRKGLLVFRPVRSQVWQS